MRQALRYVARRYLQPWSRRRKARLALSRMRAWDASSVLAVGVYPNPPDSLNNHIERELEREAERFVALGLIAAPHRWSLYVAADARALPFRDQSFDLVYANAVIEHVGDERDQMLFMDELERVGRNWIATTPNRWFPVELHTYTLFLHWGSKWQKAHVPRGITRLLGRREFGKAIPRGRVSGVISPTLTAISDRSPRSRIRRAGALR